MSAPQPDWHRDIYLPDAPPPAPGRVVRLWARVRAAVVAITRGALVAVLVLTGTAFVLASRADASDDPTTSDAVELTQEPSDSPTEPSSSSPTSSPSTEAPSSDSTSHTTEEPSPSITSSSSEPTAQPSPTAEPSATQTPSPEPSATSPSAPAFPSTTPSGTSETPSTPSTSPTQTAPPENYNQGDDYPRPPDADTTSTSQTSAVDDAPVAAAGGELAATGLDVETAAFVAFLCIFAGLIAWGIHRKDPRA